jgi:hypothetical protein
MAEIAVGSKRKRKGLNPELVKRLKVIEERQDTFIFAIGKMFQIVLKTHQLVSDNKQQLALQDDNIPAAKQGCMLTSFFSKTASKTGLTRAHVYAEMMCSNIYPTDVELCTAFLEKKDGEETKRVKKWWNLHRHKIIKYIYLFTTYYSMSNKCF